MIQNYLVVESGLPIRRKTHGKNRTNVLKHNHYLYNLFFFFRFHYGETKNPWLLSQCQCNHEWVWKLLKSSAASSGKQLITDLFVKRNNNPGLGSVGVEWIQTVDETQDSVMDTTRSIVDYSLNGSMNSC